VARDRAAIEEDRAALGQARAALAADEARVAERESRVRAKTDDKLNDRLRNARDEIDAVVAALKSKAASLGDQAERRAPQGRASLSTGEVGGLRAEARAALGALADRFDLDADNGAGGATFDEPPDIGTTVHVPAFASDGVVRGVS